MTSGERNLATIRIGILNEELYRLEAEERVLVSDQLNVRAEVVKTETELGLIRAEFETTVKLDVVNLETYRSLKSIYGEYQTLLSDRRADLAVAATRLRRSRDEALAAKEERQQLRAMLAYVPNNVVQLMHG